MRIYTRTGDAGQTSVLGGRVSKDDPRVEACGAVDELNSFIGQAVSGMGAAARYEDMRRDLLGIQHELFDCGTDLALLKPQLPYQTADAAVEKLEAQIDRYASETPPLARFVLPGGCPVSAALHVARSVCRRAERRTVTLGVQQHAHEPVRRYLNRLSDLLFTMARAANQREGVADVEYVRSSGSPESAGEPDGHS